MLDRFVNFFTSLRLTVVLLGLALVLVFVGTLAEVHLGLYEVQSRYFRSFFVFWTPSGSSLRLPILPGGWLIGTLLLMNLLAAHAKRLHFTRRKIGIYLVHSGLILLLLGQFLTEIFQIESQMRLDVGGSKNYAEDSRKNELAIIDTTDPAHDSVVAIPESLLARGGDITTPALPFTLRVKNYLQNSVPAGPISGDGEKIKATQGIGTRLLFSPAPANTRMDDENKPAALVQIVTPDGPMGDWIVSTWLSKHPWINSLQEELGSLLDIPLDAPQSFNFNGHSYQIALRPVRYYKPYTITLLDFKHDIYPGTDIPSNFSSKIHLNDPTRGEDRDVLIRMNSPLRYRGETFYQASFEPCDKVSILQVVRNPAAPTPYIACLIVGIGLIIQFLTHLAGFARKRAAQIPVAHAGVPIPLAAKQSPVP